MRKSKILYDFGISQDDPGTELRALKLSPGDRVLCIASGGEVPLELLAKSDESIEIDAVDISDPQLYLANLKFQAAVGLEGLDAARFLGYLPAEPTKRRNWFDQISRNLPTKEVRFWMENPVIFKKGPIHYGRYETYIARFAPVGRWLLGGDRKLKGLFECGGIEEQKAYFDEALRTRPLMILFKLMFHRRLYRNRGVSEQGLIHMTEENTGIRFFRKFRGFCTHTPARKNWYLQFMLFHRVIFEEALPVFLQERGQKKLRREQNRLTFFKKTYLQMVEESPEGRYNKFVFSNISDWLPEHEMMHLMNRIAGKSGKEAAGLIRFIHSPGINLQDLNENIKLDSENGEQLLKEDRFPFYQLIPFKVGGLNCGK